MASMQCQKPVHEQQGYAKAQDKVYYSETKYTDHGVAKTQGCYTETTQYQNIPVAAHHSHTQMLSGHVHNNDGQCGVETHHKHHHHHHRGHNHSYEGATCNNKRGERKKRGLFQKIKDRISGDSSSSDSESDDENCCNRKN